jgi:hypothetical protein
MRGRTLESTVTIGQITLIRDCEAILGVHFLIRVFVFFDDLQYFCFSDMFWLAVLYIVVRLTLADSKAVLLAYYASLRLFSCSYFTYILRSAVAQPNLLACRSHPLMSGLPRRR